VKRLVLVVGLSALVIFGLFGYVSMFLTGRAQELYPIVVSARTVDPTTTPPTPKTIFYPGDEVGVEIDLTFPYPYFDGGEYWYYYYYSGLVPSQPLNYMLWVTHFNNTDVTKRLVLNRQYIRPSTAISPAGTDSFVISFGVLPAVDPSASTPGFHVLRLFVFSDFPWEPAVRGLSDGTAPEATVQYEVRTT